jgi:hypothetical protein
MLVALDCAAMRAPLWIAGLFTIAVGGCSPSSPYVMTDGGPDRPAANGVTERLDFAATPAGVLPPQLVSVLGDWAVSSPPADWGADAPAGDTGARVLKQRGQYHDADAPRVVRRELSFADVHIKVRCSMEDGLDARACGLMFRFGDSDHYYVARADALQDDVRLYRVSGGERTELARRNVQLSSGTWHVLETFAEGSHLRVVWDGQDVLSAEDASFTRGKVGLWTEADSVTLFDGLEATETDLVLE